MNAAVLTSGLLAGAEFMINRMLALDPAGRTRLLAHAGTVFGIHCTGPSVKLSVLLTGTGLHLSAAEERDCDFSISGSPLALAELLGSPSSRQALNSGKVKISGDMELAQSIQNTLSGMKIDWEFYLSRLVGDIPTQFLRDNIDSGRKIINDNVDSLLQDLDEYIHEEKNLFPDHQSVERFFDAVDGLKLDVDRLDARIGNLEKSTEQDPAPKPQN